MSESKAWLCTVCGYVHHDDEPPEMCPACGATADLFVLKEPENPVVKTPVSDSWRCLNCEYIYQGECPPEDGCPICGAADDRFEAYDTEAIGAPSKLGEGEKIVIIGAGIAGVSAAEAIRERSYLAEIEIISNDKEYPYYRLNLTRYLAGEVFKDSLFLRPERWYEENKIGIRLESEVCQIDPVNKRIALKDGNYVGYTKLIIASGAHAFMPPFAGSHKGNIALLRHKSDADQILKMSKRGTKCVCVGGGILGLEAAGALARRSVEVTVIEGHGWLLPRQLNKTAGDILEKHAESLGIKFIKNVRVKEFVGDENAYEILLDDNTEIHADFFIVTTGVRSNTYFARKAGLTVDRGIVADDYLTTSDPEILVAGDACQHRGTVYGIWGPAMLQGQIAGANALGEKLRFDGIPRSNMLKVLNFDLFSIGYVNPDDAGCETFEEVSAKKYCYFVFRDNRMIGSITLGDTSLSAEIKHAIENKTDFSDILCDKPSAQKIVNILTPQP